MEADKGRVSLAWKELDQIPQRIVEKYYNECKNLDLTNNNIREVNCLKDFANLEILVLDGNQISEHTAFPSLKKLETLWVNRNQIKNLSAFIDKLVDAVPDLRHLSMLNNEACPNYFNGGTLKQYKDYRYYVIARMRGLITLDDQPITPGEKEEALRLYGNLKVKVARDEKERRKLDSLKKKKVRESIKRNNKIHKKKERKLAGRPKEGSDSDWTSSSESDWSSDD